MSITWRPAIHTDLEPSLLIQTKHRGDAFISLGAAIQVWQHLLPNPFFSSAVLEASPRIAGHHLIGFGASVIVSTAFMDAEIANPRPDITSRVIAGVHSGEAVLASRYEIARANAGEGIDVVILTGSWLDRILTPDERREAQTLLASSFTEWHSGYRIRRILTETAEEATRTFLERSVVYQLIAEFPKLGRAIHLMTRESAEALPASLGSVLFTFREPVLRLRESDQQLLRAAITGATDVELAEALGITFAAVKARWRSTFVRIGDVLPDLLNEADEHHSRGCQKRHRVLAYLRRHTEELRPYSWKTGLEQRSQGPIS